MAPWLLLGTACSVQQQNGNDIRLEQPFLLSNQNWKITQQAALPEGDRVCTVSYGEMDVTQRSHNHVVIQQVGTSNSLNPGDSYKILAGEHNYESLESWFDPRQSKAIIKDLMASDTIYTEARVGTTELGHAGPVLRSVDNEIFMKGFASQYKQCSRFVKS